MAALNTFTVKIKFIIKTARLELAEMAIKYILNLGCLHRVARVRSDDVGF
jgi:hypothetical protein